MNKKLPPPPPPPPKPQPEIAKKKKITPIRKQQTIINKIIDRFKPEPGLFRRIRIMFLLVKPAPGLFRRIRIMFLEFFVTICFLAMIWIVFFFETTTCKNQYGLIYNSRFPREGCIYNTMLITKNHLIMLSGFLFLGSLFLLNKKKD